MNEFFQAFSNFWVNLGQQLYDNFIYEDRWLLMMRGVGVTVYITFFAVVVGTILGLIFCFCRISKSKLLNKIGATYVFLIRGTPTVIQVMLIYFGVFGSVAIPKEIAAIIAFGINSGAYMTEIMRGGILAVSNGQMEAGRSLGLSHWQTMRHIILPQAFKNMIPTYTSEVIVLLKETAIIGLIGLKETTGWADYIRSRTFSVFTPYLGAAVLYLILTSVLTVVFNKMERRMRLSDQR